MVNELKPGTAAIMPSTGCSSNRRAAATLALISDWSSQPLPHDLHRRITQRRKLILHSGQPHRRSPESRGWPCRGQPSGDHHTPRSERWHCGAKISRSLANCSSISERETPATRAASAQPPARCAYRSA